VEKKKNEFIATLEGRVYMRTDLFECMARHGERVTSQSDDEAYEETRRLTKQHRGSNCAQPPTVYYSISAESHFISP